MKVLSTMVLVLLTVASFSQFEIIDNMPTYRCQFTMATDGELIYMPGGLGEGFRDEIDIYNTTTQSWEDPWYLSTPRRFVSAVVGDSAIYFVAGDEDNGILEGTNVMDVYQDGAMSTITIPDTIMGASVVKVGSKLYLGSLLKRFTTSAEIIQKILVYDESTEEWSSIDTPNAKISFQLMTDGEKLYCAGGSDVNGNTTSQIDIYDLASETWSTDQLSSNKMGVSALAVDGKLIFAGGGGGDSESSSAVDIYDGDSWTTEYLQYPRAFPGIAVTPHKILFVGGGGVDPDALVYTYASDFVDIYDRETGEWDVDFLSDPRFNHGTIAVGDIAYVAGGADIGGNIYNLLEASDFYVGTDEIIGDKLFGLFPNPASESLYLAGLDLIQDFHQIIILNSAGALVRTFDQKTKNIDISDLPSGMYTMTLVTQSGIQTKKFVKM